MFAHSARSFTHSFTGYAMEAAGMNLQNTPSQPTSVRSVASLPVRPSPPLSRALSAVVGALLLVPGLLGLGVEAAGTAAPTTSRATTPAATAPATAGAKPATGTPAGNGTGPAAAPSGSKVALDPALEAVVSKIQGTYAKFESYRADFTQTIHTSSLARPRVDTGVVELKKGGKMHWEFKTPDVRHFISDGKMLWVYSPADKQALASPLAQDASTTALNFMAGLGDIRRDFQVSLPTDAEAQKKGMVALQLVPKESIGTLKRLIVLASESDGVVREAIVQDQLGSKTVMEFINVQLNGKLDDARFNFVAPKGVNVIQTAGY